MPITRGSTPATAPPAKAPSGSTPSSRAFSADAITSAAAPSLIPEEFPAVTVPLSRNAGFSAESLSRSVSGRGCSSRSTSPTATSSSAKRPASAASAQRCCDRSAKASWSSRVTAHRSATFSPVSPIDSSGNFAARRGFGNSQPRVVSYAVRSPRGNALSGFPITSGARDIDSTPPATKRSPSPAATAWQAETTAERPDAQRRFTVTPATDSGKPARRTAIRATFRLSSPAWFAQPKYTSSISAGSAPARSTAAVITVAAKSSGRTAASAPPYRPTGVRTAEITTALGIASLLDELDPNGLVVHAQLLGPAKSLVNGLLSFVPVVPGHFVDVHADEAVGEADVEPAAEAQRVAHRLLAICKPGANRLAEDVAELAQPLGPEIASRDVDAERQRKTRPQ